MEKQYKKKWNKIIYFLKQKCSTEKDYQEKVLLSLEVLDYEISKDIEKEHPVSVGSNNRGVKIDFLIKGFFVVEVKQPSAEKKNSSEQLLSYMRLTRLKLGLLIAGNIKIFYDDSSVDNPVVKEIKLKNDSSSGLKFVETFCKENFITHSESYIKEILKEKKDTELKKKLKKEIQNSDFTPNIKDFIRQKFASSDIKDEMISSVLDDLTIEIKIKDKLNITNNTESNKLKIGQYVQQTVKDLLSKNLISNDEIKNLLNLNYSKNTFGLNRPFFVESQDETLDNKGNKRYYIKKFGNYYLNSQWGKRHRDRFLNWEKKQRN